MRIIPPKAITDAVLLACNVPENDHAEWSSTTAYAIGDYCIVTSGGVHRVYQALTANTNKYPPTNVNITSPPWQDLGATNKWRMFDGYVNTQAENADSISVTLDASRCDSVILFGVDAANVTLSLSVGGTVVHSETVSMSQHVSSSWTDYFFDTFVEASDLSRPVPLYGIGAQLTITLTRTGGTAKLGHLVIGRAIYMGGTRYNPKAGIDDYSTKSTTDAGDTYLKQGAYSKTLSAEIRVNNENADYVFNKTTSLRATPLVWDLNNPGGAYAFLIVYGFFKDFSLVFSTPRISVYSLEIEGMI